MVKGPLMHPILLLFRAFSQGFPPLLKLQMEGGLSLSSPLSKLLDRDGFLRRKDASGNIIVTILPSGGGKIVSGA